MKNWSRSILIALHFVLLNCSNVSYEAQIKSKIENYLINESDSYDYVVLIPGSGCSGCITNAENYFIENVSNLRTKFIFTKILSKKELALKLGIDNLQRKNVLLDSLNYFYLSSYEERIYPYIMQLTNNKVMIINKLN